MSEVELGLQTHHVGVLVKDLGIAIERYTQALGYTVRSSRFHDPIQTAHVQFLQLPGDSMLLELIAPDGPESRLSTALRKGGGINHICYSTPNLVETIDTLRKRGYFLIYAPQPAVAFDGRSIAWVMNSDNLLIELVEKTSEGQL